ncbi:MAG: hydrolase 1, exosortase A system-associated [Pseudomonadota bacterium]
MRRPLNFTCEGHALTATLDSAHSKTGLLIVSGGNEIRIGAHRGMAKLAGDIAAAGYPVFRFDRRGIGDSEGENGGFTKSGPDIAAAIKALRDACPELTRIVVFGNCDAASALLLHRPAGIAAHILTNIWIIEPTDDLPPPAAIRARYSERMKDPKAWIGLFTGTINLRKLIGGLMRIAKPQVPSPLAHDVAAGLAVVEGPVTILLAEQDGTAIAFIDAWNGPAFSAARRRSDIKIKKLASASHSFATASDYAVLRDTIIETLSQP